MKQSKRVAFCGASGTGKSTLAKFVAERYGLPMNPVGSRSVSQAMGFDSPYDVDKAGKRAEFQHRLMAEKVAWEAEHDAFVTDRTTVDVFVYTAMHESRSLNDLFFQQMVNGLRRYTHIVVCPMGAFFNLESDTARLHNEVYHRAFDCFVQQAVIEWFDGEGTFVWMLHEGLAERQSELADALDEWCADMESKP